MENGGLILYNIFFQGDKVVDMRILDWQLLREASPVTDLAHVLFVGTDKKLRDKYYKNIIALYYNTLATNVTNMGVNIDEYYPELVYRDHLKKYMRHGLIMAIIYLPLILVENGEVIDITEHQPNKEFSINNKVKERVKGVIEDCIKYGYI